MALFRSIPVEVEAVQFGGMKSDEPVFNETGGSIPAWLWRNITKGAITFKDHGVFASNVKLDQGDWIVWDGAFIEVFTDEKFQGTFVKARKAISEMATSERFTGRKAKAADTTTPAPIPEPAPEPYPMPEAAPEPYPMPEAAPEPYPMPEAAPTTATLAAPFPDTPIANQAQPVQADEADQIMDRLMAGTITQ